MAAAGKTSPASPACTACGRHRVELRRRPPPDLCRVRPRPGRPSPRPPDLCRPRRADWRLPDLRRAGPFSAAYSRGGLRSPACDLGRPSVFPPPRPDPYSPRRPGRVRATPRVQSRGRLSPAAAGRSFRLACRPSSPLSASPTSCLRAIPGALADALAGRPVLPPCPHLVRHARRLAAFNPPPAGEHPDQTPDPAQSRLWLLPHKSAFLRNPNQPVTPHAHGAGRRSAGPPQ